MKLTRCIFTLTAILLLCCGRMAAQELPAIAKASEITTGRLPNGITFYLVKNSSTPGYADFALVQPKREKGSSPRENLVSLPHFFGRKPYKFLADNGVGYGERGWIQNTRGATIFRFADVPVSASEVSDSTLLMLFDIARATPYEQALVVSGNIDIDATLERIRILSMTISQRLEAGDPSQYSWKQQENMVVTSSRGPVGEVSVSYRAPRTDRALMNTVQPVMSRVLAGELQTILERRLRSAFALAGVPLADYRFRYIASEQTAGDEMFIIRINTAADKLPQAAGVLAGVLSSLDEDGATEEEVAFTRAAISGSYTRDARNLTMTNAQWVDKCISSYLYGSNLASESTIKTIFEGRRLDIGRETELLNRYIAATLSPKRNTHLQFSAPLLPDEATLGEAFRIGWEHPLAAVGDVPVMEDTLLLASPRRKVRLKTTSADSMSGGKMWTFSNGISVIYKKMPTDGTFRYGFMVKGGWAEVKGITGAESAFAVDVLRLEKVAGMSGDHFKDLLLMNGIHINPQVTLSDVRFTGSAPKDRLPLLLKSLLSLCNSHEPDTAAFARYRSERAIRLVRDKFSLDGTRAVLDSTMCPGYRYAVGSLPPLPGSDFPVRIDEYLTQKGNTVRNGLLVLVGDLNEAMVLKFLTHSLGDFRTNQQRVVRPRVPYPLRECWTTSYDHGTWRESGVSVSLCALQPFSPESATTLELACKVLEAELIRSLVSRGVRCSVSGTADLLPTERLTVWVNCKACPASGVPSSVSPATPMQTLAAVREVVNRLAVSGVDAATLARCKKALTNRYASQDGNAGVLRDALMYRNAMGRDLLSGRASRVKSVRADELQRLFIQLSECNCEYVVQ